MWTRGAENFRGRVRMVAVRRSVGCGIVGGDAGESGCPDRRAVRGTFRTQRHFRFRDGVCIMAASIAGGGTGFAVCRLHKTVDGRNIRFLFRFDRGYVLDSGTVGEDAAGSGGGIRMPVPSGGSDPCRPERCGRDVRRGPSRSRSACGRETAGPSGRFRDKPEAEEGESDIFA